MSESDFIVNENTVNAQLNQKIAAWDNGGFIVGYTSEHAYVGVKGICARAYLPDLSFVNNEIMIEKKETILHESFLQLVGQTSCPWIGCRDTINYPYVFEISNLDKCWFENIDNVGIQINSFDENDLKNGKIKFIVDVDDPSDLNLVSFNINDYNGKFSYNYQNHSLVVNALTVISNQFNAIPIVMNTNLGLSTDRVNNLFDPQIGNIDIIFRVNVNDGKFVNSDSPMVPIFQFSQKDVLDGKILFVIDLTDGRTPSNVYDVTVDFGSFESAVFQSQSVSLVTICSECFGYVPPDPPLFTTTEIIMGAVLIPISVISVLISVIFGGMFLAGRKKNKENLVSKATVQLEDSKKV